jgi:hypothetical protein
MTRSNNLREIEVHDVGILYDRIDAIKIMPEEDALNMFNVDSKDEYIALLYEEIAAREENYSYDCSPLDDDDGMDYSALASSQGLSYCAFVKC